MVGAFEAVGETAALGAQAAAPVLAHVVHRPHLAGGGAHNQHGLGADFKSEVVTDLGQVGERSGVQPHPAPHPLPFQAHHRGRQVAFLGNQLRIQGRLGALFQNRGKRWIRNIG